MSRRTTRRAALPAVVATFAGALGAPAAVAATPSLTLTSVGSPATRVSGSGQLASSGDTGVDITVAQLSGGQATVTAGPDGALPKAVQFPPYVASGTYPRAVVRVAPTSGAGLDPGSADFEFGAVLRCGAPPGRSSSARPRLSSATGGTWPAARVRRPG